MMGNAQHTSVVRAVVSPTMLLIRSVRISSSTPVVSGGYGFVDEGPISVEGAAGSGEVARGDRRGGR